MAVQVGIPIFPIMELRGAKLRFRDDFADAAIYWGWEEYKGTLDLANKTIQEINGQMRLTILGTNRGFWDENHVEAPKIFMGNLTFPCEIITKLDSVTTPINDETLAGLFITKRPVGFGANLHYSIGRARDTSRGLNGLAVMRDSFTILASNAVTTLPIWFRIRFCSDSPMSTHAYFDYSVDGITWVNLYELTGYDVRCFTVPPSSVGLYVVNGLNSTDGGTTNGIYGRFDYFKMQPHTIN